MRRRGWAIGGTLCLAIGGLSWSCSPSTQLGITIDRVHVLDDNEGTFAYSRISPDGSLLAYTSLRPQAPDGTSRNVRLVDLETGTTVFETKGLDAYWSPDGHELVFLDQSTSTDSVSILEIDTRRVRREGIRLPGAGLIFSSGNGRKWTEPSGKLLHDEVVPAQICRHRSVGLCGCEEAGNEGHEGRLAGRRTCAEHVAVESAHGRLAVPLSPRQLVGASSAATVGPAGSLAGRWVWRLPRRTPVPRGGARPRGSRRRRRRHEDTRRGPTSRTAASCLVACPPLAAKPTGRGLGRRRDGAD